MQVSDFMVNCGLKNTLWHFYGLECLNEDAQKKDTLHWGWGHSNCYQCHKFTVWESRSDHLQLLHVCEKECSCNLSIKMDSAILPGPITHTINTMHLTFKYCRFSKNLAPLFIWHPFSSSKIISTIKNLEHATFNGSCNFIPWQILVVKQGFCL